MSGQALRAIPEEDLRTYIEAQALYFDGRPVAFAEWCLSMTELVLKDPTYWFAWYAKAIAAARIREDAIACDLFAAAHYFLPRPIPKMAKKLAAEMFFNWGRCEQMLMRDDAARLHFLDAISIDPFKAPVWSQLGLVYLAQGEPERALRCLTKATTLPDASDPSIRWNRALAQLLLGDWPAGFAGYEMRWKMPQHLDRHGRPELTQPWWDGQPFDGTLLLWTEQGYGDNIQMLRYLPMIRERVTRLLVQAPLDLHVLIGSSFPGVPLLAPGDPIPEYDRHAPFLSVPHLMGTSVDTVPAPGRYLTPASSGQRIAARERMAVGVVWAGNPLHPSDNRRSIPFADFAPLLDVPGVDFYSLQIGEREAEAQGDARLIPSSSLNITDYNDTAAVIDQLDLVIAADTSVVHIAGALGKPVWVLLPAAPDWRWLLSRDDTPWYPSMRLYRQTKTGAWPEVIERVIADLAKFGQALCMTKASEYAAMAIDGLFPGSGHSRHNETGEG